MQSFSRRSEHGKESCAYVRVAETDHFLSLPSVYAESIPPGYMAKVASTTVTETAQKGLKSFWKVATQESTGFNIESRTALQAINDPTRMALAQLGSCKFDSLPHPPKC